MFHPLFPALVPRKLVLAVAAPALLWRRSTLDAAAIDHFFHVACHGRFVALWSRVHTFEVLTEKVFSVEDGLPVGAQSIVAMPVG